MSILDRLFPHRRVNDLIVLWETRVKPDLQTEVDNWALGMDDSPSQIQNKKGERALLQGFLDRVESRIVTLAVNDSLSKADNKRQAVLVPVKK